MCQFGKPGDVDYDALTEAGVYFENECLATAPRPADCATMWLQLIEAGVIVTWPDGDEGIYRITDEHLNSSGKQSGWYADLVRWNNQPVEVQ